MKYMVMIYTDPAMLDAMPQHEYDSQMRGCLAKADAMRAGGKLLDSQMLEPTETAKAIRVRGGRRTVTDGPFAETKEVLAGYNIIEAEDMDEALRLASEFPWANIGCIEVRPVREIATVRARVGAA